MAERDTVGGASITPEDKEASTQAAVEFHRKTISEKHGVLNQDMLMELTDEQLTQRMLEIADRGFVSFRLKVPMDDGWYGEWAPSDPASIAEYQMKGFVIDDKFAPKYGLHSDATGKPIVGDVIHMICPTRVKEAHDRVAKIKFDRVHGRKRDLPEETNFKNQVEASGLPTTYKDKDINTSSQAQINQSQLLNAVKGS